MKIEINRLNDGFWMEAVNENGNKIHIDASPEVGGTDRGFRPMQMLLAALGGCSSIDIISILKKQKQPLEDIKITITGNRQKMSFLHFLQKHMFILLFMEISMRIK